MTNHMLFLLCAFAPLGTALCPMGHGNSANTALPANHPRILSSPSVLTKVTPIHDDYYKAARALDYEAVKDDLRAFFRTSDTNWPSDYTNYGPFFVRLAWHCSGSYRTSDGRGGCAGGRQRFDPERSWADNTNLDKARGLLWPIKRKYGLGLSWGDLFILAGTTAVESMGGPTLGFCAGRPDAADGAESQKLGPTMEQEAFAPCPVNGKCKKPLGSTTIGLIYLNPEGPMGEPVPAESAGEVRDTFGRMAMNDSETVALIGGGHAFGKTHGACPLGPGKSPKEDPANPWPGKCGSGKGADAFTSGFEGPWTTSPTKWDNEYFKYLVDFQWEKHKGPGGHWQWRVANASSPTAPSVDLKGRQNIMRLTSDVSLMHDPTGKYQKIVRAWAEDGEGSAAFDNAFKHAWYKLTTRDMGPVTRCLGKNVPAPQDWQFPLPLPPARPADYDRVRRRLRDALDQDAGTAGGDVTPHRPNYFGAAFVRLAYQCASTFRRTDYQGGCNGARLRFSPQRDWTVNRGLNEVLSVLEPIKDEFGEALSWADLIVLAGNVALEDAGAGQMPFCPGRTDARDGAGSKYLNPSLVTGDIADSTVAHVREKNDLLGLTTRQMVALSARLRSPFLLSRIGFAAASYGAKLDQLSNDYFNVLMDEDWVLTGTANQSDKRAQYRSKANPGLFMLASDLALKYDPTYAAAVHDMASDNGLFLDEFRSAWTTLMNADRFDGPGGNLCAATPEPGIDGTGDSPAVGFQIRAPVFAGAVAGTAGVVLAVCLVVYFACLRPRRREERLAALPGELPYSTLAAEN